MKKITLIAFLLIGLSGCAFLKDQQANWKACAADPACVSQAKDWQSKVQTVAVPAAALVPLPGAAAIPPVLGYIALGLAMLIGGHSIRKNQASQTTNTTPTA